jgi:hypothetical protein
MPADSPRPSHWDFMLEDGDVLRTWALDQELMPDVAVVGHELAEHRLEYLEYEGPIDKNRGAVRRVDRGPYSTILKDRDRWYVALEGATFRGELWITKSPADSQRWTFAFGGSP